MIGLLFVQGVCGFLGLALFAIYVERQTSPSWRRIVCAVILALACSVIAIKAEDAQGNVLIPDTCAIYDSGSWEWWIQGCYLPKWVR